MWVILELPSLKLRRPGVKSDFAKVTTSPRSFAFDPSGNLFVTQSVSAAVSKFAPDGYRNRGRSAAEDKRSSPEEDIHKLLG
jgi:DNA-binding beta-propeller fold protein YncE